MQRSLSLFGVIALFLVAAPPLVYAQLGGDPVAGCKFRHPVESVAAYKDLPEPVGDAAGWMAEKGEPFNSTDYFQGNLPTRRFMGAGRSGDLCVVWYVQGGFFLSSHVRFFRWTQGDMRAQVIARDPDHACIAFDDLLDGKAPN